ncbi:hypothetical protein P152DRAFT_476523 [Eremomyces bilateralis CBS 781.70]|uniref:Tyrosine specific protein phosphatases domain-containing protein n=1 Tax=Eremomyces bilateralis CBS 781.70 TaxID=1392243 RepID=A0A6G1FUE1_9PEZI|nr:uncharacterized protein P152DRAFT_476523 [Eremomyces bilateralis CBS 781.70]KAF1809394.1 hypothetical protein P152DRAFT_476523 [Eremomyces bilateralis CBS 781.70]
MFHNRGAAARKKKASQGGEGDDLSATDPHLTDPGLLRKHTTFRPYTVPSTGITYPRIRTFYRPHPYASKLPSRPRSLPLLVFCHGLGGSVAQFAPLLTSLVNLGPCLAIDLPGCGRSQFAPTNWEAYGCHALAELVATAIHEHLDMEVPEQDDASDSDAEMELIDLDELQLKPKSTTREPQQIILIGHSMGTFHLSLLASATSPLSREACQLRSRIIGIIPICPGTTTPSKKVTRIAKVLLNIPTPIFQAWRSIDQRGGPQSASVLRFAGEDADEETRRLQWRYNIQSVSKVWRRYVWGLLPKYIGVEAQENTTPGRRVWSGVKCPMLLVAGELDSITKPTEIPKILAFLGREDAVDSLGQCKEQQEQSSTFEIPDSAAPIAAPPIPTANDSDDSPNAKPASPAAVSSTQYIETHTLVGARHTLLYATTTRRALAGLIATFLRRLDPRLDAGWQLQHLTTEGKWDVKNLEKWRRTPAVSGVIAGQFRAMKVLREVDETHTPDTFAGTYGRSGGQTGGVVVAVVDISHETPPYQPRGLEGRGIKYHKFPTVSKLQPSREEANGFFAVIDGIIQEIAASDSDSETSLIAVHCHYGFNRTGFFLVSYMVERLGWTLGDAIEVFARMRAPGIRHQHFLDTLWVRYGLGETRAG